MSKPVSKKEKVQAIVDILDELYPEVPIPLDHKDPYTLLIAVLLSAQCTDERVNQITPKLFARADNPFDMVLMSIDEIKEIIKPCGLSPMKSKGIWHLSDMIIKQHNGEVPQDIAALEAMPGVGHKTASVVMSQAFGVPLLPRGHPHSPPDVSLGPVQRQERRANRTRCQALVPEREVEQPSLADHLLRAGVLPSQGLLPGQMHHHPRVRTSQLYQRGVEGTGEKEQEIDPTSP